MNRDNFFTRIINRLRAGKQSLQPSAVDHQSNEMMGKLLRMVENTDEVEIGCNDVFELLDQYVELAARGENVADLLPLVKRHLDKCQDCYEEFEALARVFEATSLGTN